MHNESTVSGTIYALHNGDGVHRYIGYTTLTPEKRLEVHKKDSSRERYRHRAVYKWVRKYGVDSIYMDVLEHYPEIMFKDLKEREVVRISQGLLEGLDLLNGTKGGDGAYGYRFSDESKAKMSEARKGIPKTEEHKAKIGASNRGKTKTFTEEWRSNLGKSQIGRVHSEETRAKISISQTGENNANYGRKATKETKEKMALAKVGKPHKGQHTRYCINKQQPKPDCVWCMV